MKYPKRCQYKHAKQKKYHVRNWAEYNEGLRRRGDLTVWFDEEAIANWKADKTGKPGGQRVYSDMAIETGLVVRMVYKLAYRQTEGFLHSIASLLGLGIEIPDYSTLCRRSRLLRKKLRIPKAASTQPIHLMIDSTGLRIHVGNARKPPKQRAWRKLHIAVDRETGNIVASELTASRARDATRVPALLTQIQAPLVSVAADSAYDKALASVGLAGLRLDVGIPCRDFVDSSDHGLDEVAWYIDSASIPALRDFEITSQEFVNSSVIVVNGTRVEVDLSDQG